MKLGADKKYLQHNTLINDLNLKSGFFLEMCAPLRFKKTRTSPFQQCNGMVWRFNKHK